jgi:hypothetical protein
MSVHPCPEQGHQESLSPCDQGTTFQRWPWSWLPELQKAQIRTPGARATVVKNAVSTSLGLGAQDELSRRLCLRVAA